MAYKVVSTKDSKMGRLRRKRKMVNTGTLKGKISEFGNYSIARISILLISFFPQMDNKVPMSLSVGSQG